MSASVRAVRTAARPPRLPGMVFAATCAVLFALVAAVAMTAKSASPPSVAELAPQAVEEITKDEDAGTNDLGIGSEPGADATTAEEDREAAGADPDDIAAEDEPDEQAVRRCVGSPPRQIEDPQSPPCVAYWEGDNGGKTWKGVTGDQITVAVGVMTDSSTGQPVLDHRAIKMYEQFFNRRFEFYGRQLNLVPYATAPPASPASAMVRDATKVDEQIGAFAGVMYSEQDGLQTVYFDALAKRQIMGVLTGILGMSRATEEHLRRFAPYQWDYVMSADRMLRGYGEFICSQLAHKPARYAGRFSWSPNVQPIRKFGVILSIEFAAGPPFDVEPLRRALASCDTTLEVFEYDGGAQASVLIADLQEQRITDVLYTGQSGILALRLMPAAAGQGYFPEWLVSNMGYQDRDDSALYFPTSQREHVIGLQVYNKTLRNEDMPFQWALREIDPAAAGNYGNEQYMRLYQSLLVLASGIQAAGPELTPTRFESGLMRTRFPNPNAAAAPYYQARVGFPGVHTMVQDLVPVWLSSTERSPASGRPPTYCYVDLGIRYGLGEWKPREPAFHGDARGPCR